MAEDKSSRENWGFFESVLKIGFGVAFGFLVYDTLVPMWSSYWQFLTASAEGFPWWSLIFVYLFWFLLSFGFLIVIPMAPVTVVVSVLNKIESGVWAGEPLWPHDKAAYGYFLLIWIYGFWAVLAKFGVIS